MRFAETAGAEMGGASRSGLVTLITAVRNGASQIGATLESVAAQDWPAIEHIVIDGASTDDTVERVRRSRAKVTRLVSETDTGVYDAFNKGLRLANGEVIAFLNCGDTYASSGVVSAMMRELSLDPGLQAVYADVTITDASGRPRRRYSSRGFTPDRMRFGFMPAHPSLFMRTCTYRRLGGYDTSYRIAADFEFCLRAFWRERIQHRYSALNAVYMPNGGLSNRGWRSKLTITREMHRACINNGVPTSYARLLLRIPLKLLELRP